MWQTTDLTDRKPPWLSLGILGGLVSIAAGISGISGAIADDPAQEQTLANVPLVNDLYLYVLAIVGGSVSIFGRIRAKKRIRWSP
ncbi:MAG: hypothetical protein ACT4QB_11100 [Gammaproteobacteria bacterium]